MKYILLICDGAADWQIESLGNKTIFEAADTPNLDWIATHGHMGTLKTIPEGMPPGSDCANMTIMGYRPERDLTGRGPFEALSAGIPLKDSDIAFRCNLININGDIINDYSSGHISTQESTPLIHYLQTELKENGVDFFPGVQYRHILRLDGHLYSNNLSTTPPHDLLGKAFKNYLPKARDLKDKNAIFTAEILNILIEKSHKFLIEHEINQKRLKEGKVMATHIWPWGGGKKPDIKSFKDKYGLTGAVISAVDLIFGIGIAAGFEPIHVEGATGLPDTNYQGKVNAALDALKKKKKDLVYLHIEATDEMAHTGDPYKKIHALELFDINIVKPILDAEKDFNNELVIIVLPDHPTPCKIRTHSNDPVPFAIYNPLKELKGGSFREYSEKSGKNGEYGFIENGEDFMKLILS